MARQSVSPGTCRAWAVISTCRSRTAVDAGAGLRQRPVRQDCADRAQGDAAPQTLMALQDLRYSAAIERTGSTLGWTTKAQTRGSVGLLVLEAVGPGRNRQPYRCRGRQALPESPGGGLTAPTPRRLRCWQTPRRCSVEGGCALFVAALPAYAVKLSATLEGQQAMLEYGAEIQTAPTADEVQARGWGPACSRAASYTGLRLPAWLPRIVQAMGQQDMPAEQIDAMVVNGAGAGFLRQEAEHLTRRGAPGRRQAAAQQQALDLPMLKPVPRGVKLHGDTVGARARTAGRRAGASKAQARRSTLQVVKTLSGDFAGR